MKEDDRINKTGVVMKTLFAKKHLVCIFLSVLVVLAGCSSPKASTAPQLTDGLATAVVPNMPLDAYLFFQQSQPTPLPGKLSSLPAEVAVQSTEVWVVPAESTEIVAASVTFLSAQDATNLFPAIPDLNELWKYLAANKIFFVYGSGSAADQLKNAIKTQQFVPLATAAPDAWELMQRFPGQPASKPPAMGFVRIQDRLLAFAQKYGNGVYNEDAVSALKTAKIEMVGMAMYSTRMLQVADLLSPANLKDTDLSGIVIAKSSYPGVAVSAALGPLAPKLSLAKTDVNGKVAYNRTIDAPAGVKVHVLLNNSDQYILATAATNLQRAQQLYGWVWGP